MDAKFHMTLEQNVFVAKRNIVDYIWKSANLEGIAVTFPDTQTIYDGISIPNMKVADIVAINNLKHAWYFLLDNIDYPIDYPFICKIHQFVGANLIMDAGYIRSVPVSMGGTSWKPDMPIEPQIKEQLAEILQIVNATDRAVTLMLYLMRKKMFLDGNKRVSMLAANQVLIQSGGGVITVPIDMQREFSAMLVRFYESGNMDEIKTFVYESCIDGIDFQPMKEPPPMVQKKEKQDRER